MRSAWIGISLICLALTAAPARAGTPYRLGDLNTAPGSPLFTVPVPPAGFISLGNKALFSTADPETGDEGILWSTDGTAPGTVALSSSLCPAPCQSIRPLAVWHGLALLQVFPGFAPPYLLRSDGTPAGTFPLTGGPVDTIQAPPSGSFFFFNHCPDSLQCGLWRSDGTLAGVDQVPGTH